jgi:inorganic pyrophosphatase
MRNIADMNKTLLTDIGRFFANYHQARGSKFKVLGFRGPKQAYRLLRKSMRSSKAA